MFFKRIYALGVSAFVLSPVIAKPHRKLQDTFEVEVSKITLFDVDTQIPNIEAVHNGEYSVSSLDLQNSMFYPFFVIISDIYSDLLLRRRIRSICRASLGRRNLRRRFVQHP